MEKNPNHKIETKNNKASESQSAKVDNSNLIEQKIDEDFLSLKNELIYFQDKSKVEEIVQNLDEGTKFLMLGDELDKEEVLQRGIDLCLVADVSESMHPWRIFLKKSMYFVLMDIESYFYTIPGVKPEDFSNVRISIVKYSDRDTDKVCDVTDFVEYKSLGDICKKIDEIEIKGNSSKKRAVFDGLNAASNLKWKEESQKIIVHWAADPQYGLKYTTEPKKCKEDYDPYPEGVKDIDDKELLGKINDLSPIFNFIKLGGRMEKYSTEVSKILKMDVCKPKVNEI